MAADHDWSGCHRIGYYIAITTESPLPRSRKFFFQRSHLCRHRNLCAVYGEQHRFCWLLRKNKITIIRPAIFTSIRHDLPPDEAERGRTCQHLHLKYHGAVDDFHHDLLYTGMNDVLETDSPRIRGKEL